MAVILAPCERGGEWTKKEEEAKEVDEEHEVRLVRKGNRRFRESDGNDADGGWKSWEGKKGVPKWKESHPTPAVCNDNERKWTANRGRGSYVWQAKGLQEWVFGSVAIKGLSCRFLGCVANKAVSGEWRVARHGGQANAKKEEAEKFK